MLLTFHLIFFYLRLNNKRFDFQFEIRGTNKNLYFCFVLYFCVFFEYFEFEICEVSPDAEDLKQYRIKGKIEEILIEHSHSKKVKSGKSYNTRSKNSDETNVNERCIHCKLIFLLKSKKLKVGRPSRIGRI